MQTSLNPALNNPVGGYSVVFSLDKNYLRPALTLMESIVSHSSKMYNFFILHEDISVFCQHVVERYAKGLNIAVYFINLAEKKIKGPSFFHFSKAMYFRLLIPSLFKAWERILYLDVDVLALSDISVAFDIIEKDKAMAASQDIFISSIYPNHPAKVLKSGNPRNYFGSGFLLYNCQNISKADIEKCLELIGKYTRMPDQDILNHVFEGQVSFIPQQLHFVLIDGDKTIGNRMREEDLREREKVTHPVLVHYAGAKKPWSKDLKSNHDGYHYYDEYQQIKERTDSKLEKIILEEASLEFP